MELSDIKGIGAKRIKSLEEAGIFTVEDLINYFPYKYYDFSKTEPFAEDGNIKLIKATVISAPKIVKINRSLSFVNAKVSDEIGHEFNAVWYNQTYMKSVLFLGQEIFLYGKNSPKKKNTFVVLLSRSAEKFESVSFLPIYKSIKNIGQKIIHDSINFCLQNAEISTFLPNELLSKYNLFNLKDAYFEIHNPTDQSQMKRARERVEIEKIIPILAINEFNKNFYKVIKSQQYKDLVFLKESYKNIIPFTLTSCQSKAIDEIEADLSSKFAMNRMLQGDVGSGKTVVAFFGCYATAKNGFQSALIAPTEILAIQHFQTAKKFFEKTDIEVELLIGSLTPTQKVSALQNISRGTAKIIIGTHAVLSEMVKFKNLSFVIVDEQHRFGVEQRAKLKAKGLSPDVLVMSATPIPRSLSLVLYGDLELSMLTFRPKPVSITTNFVSQAREDDLWNYVAGKMESGSKTYVVCSNIDEENENDSVLRYSAKSMYDRLKTIFGEENVGLIHGKLSKQSQEKIIDFFRQGKIKILVSTTIVEVGMDIPDADIMVIATPEKFGLATLHQLRGRIGRNGEEAHCFCLSSNFSQKTFERLKFFKDNYNGFEIADYDLKTRGAGSVLGTNQHGDDNGITAKFSLSSISLSKEILEQIKSDAYLFAQVIERGKQLQGSENLNKIVLN